MQNKTASDKTIEGAFKWCGEICRIIRFTGFKILIQSRVFVGCGMHKNLWISPLRYYHFDFFDRALWVTLDLILTGKLLAEFRADHVLCVFTERDFNKGLVEEKSVVVVVFPCPEGLKRHNCKKILREIIDFHFQSSISPTGKVKISL